MGQLIERTARELRSLMDRGETSSVEVCGAYLDHIDVVNGEINAIVSRVDRDAILEQAAKADAVAVDERGLLHGLPMAPKDLTATKGIPTTFGSPLFADFVPPADSLLAARLRRAGAIFVGKTNTPEMGLGSHSFNPVHGVTGNPYDTSRSAGGSSGGAAAALAANMLPVADGSDMMGSLRNPAAWCNVYGFRPTWGLVPNDGPGDHFISTLATNGPMGRNVGDLALLLDAIAGIHPPAPFPVAPVPGGYLAATEPAASDVLSIGWLGDWGGAYPCEPGVLEQCQVGLATLESMGHRVESVDAPFPAEQIWQAWTTLRSAIVAYSQRELYADADKRDLMKPEMIWEIERGLGFSVDELFAASTIRTRWYERAARLFDQYDFIVMPTAQVWPFPVEQRHPTEIVTAAGTTDMDTYHRWMEIVVPVSLIGLPSLSVPVGFGDNGLPMGFQLIGFTGRDAAVLNLGRAYEAAFGNPKR